MLSQYRTASGMSGRGEDVVTGGSTVFKVKERQQQTLGIVGLTDASGFLEPGQKRVDSAITPPVDYLNQTCNNAAHLKTQSGHHPPTFVVALARVIRWLIPLYCLGSAVHWVSPGVGLLFTCFLGGHKWAQSLLASSKAYQIL